MDVLLICWDILHLSLHMPREWTPFGKRGITVQLVLFSLDCPSEGHGRSRNRQQKGTKSSHGTSVLCFCDLFKLAHWISLNHYLPLSQKVYASWDKSCRMAHANLILCEATIRRPRLTQGGARKGRRATALPLLLLLLCYVLGTKLGGALLLRMCHKAMHFVILGGSSRRKK